MKNYYTERNFFQTEYNPIYYRTVRLNPYNIFRNFLIKENSDSVSKQLRYKKKEILPDYSNIRKKINSQIRDVKKFFDVKNTVFKEIKSKDIIAYSKFAKNMTLYFFGPQGKVTQKSQHLRRIFNAHESKNNLGLHTKIYAGKWFYLDDISKQNKYNTRLKTNKKKILNIGGHFTTDDDINGKIHGLYLKNSKIKSKDDSKIVRKRRFSTITEMKKISIFNNKNFFEYTSIEPYSRKKSTLTGEMTEKTNKRRHTVFTLPNVYKRNTIISHHTEENESSISRNKRINENKKKVYTRETLKTIKNIFLREKIEKKINIESKNHYKKLKISLNSKLNDIMKPSKALLTDINVIKRKNETFFTHRNDKDKYKEDIKVIGEDDKREKGDNMKEFVKANYKNKVFNKKDASAPRKIHFSYYDKSKDTIHNSIKEFIRDISRKKEEERERKYGKNIRQQFKANSKIIEKLGMNLDNLKSSGNI
jgi:hypothetical protein